MCLAVCVYAIPPRTVCASCVFIGSGLRLGLLGESKRSVLDSDGKTGNASVCVVFGRVLLFWIEMR